MEVSFIFSKLSEPQAHHLLHNALDGQELHCGRE